MTRHSLIRTCEKQQMLHWTKVADDSSDHLDWSQMANGELLRPVMSPSLKSPPWSTH